MTKQIQSSGKYQSSLLWIRFLSDTNRLVALTCDITSKETCFNKSLQQFRQKGRPINKKLTLFNLVQTQTGTLKEKQKTRSKTYVVCVWRNERERPGYKRNATFNKGFLFGKRQVKFRQGYSYGDFLWRCVFHDIFCVHSIFVENISAMAQQRPVVYWLRVSRI